MEPTITLQHLTDKTNNPSVVCRVIKTWDIIYPGSGRSRHMRYLLVDTEGTGIEAEITKADQSLLPVKPDDGNVYLFRQFRVETPTNGYNATGHNFIMRMTKWTEARRIDNLAVQPPLFYFNFKEFEDIGTTIRGSRVVVDVIGRISSIGPIEQINTQTGLTDIRDILIENIRGKTLRITVWPTFLPLINEADISEASKHSPVVFAFSSLELKSYNREPFLKTYSATKIYKDQTHPHIAQYLELFGERNSPINVLQPRVFQPSKASKMTTPIGIALKDLITLEPYNNKDQQFSCIAKIEGIVNQDSWSYSACPECKVSTYYDGSSTTCHNCQTIITTTIQWYRLILRVTDGETTTEFTVIGKPAENIINKKADMVFAESRRIGKMVPPSLENIYGKSFMFIVEINISQLHKQRLTYDVNKVEAVPAALPQPPQTHPTLSNIREDHFSMPSDSRISMPKRKAAHTGLSPQTPHSYIESSMDNPTSSQSSRSKRKILPQLNEENSSSSVLHSVDDESSNTTTP